MGKYEHVILLSDMDGTLLNTSSKISGENKMAIEAFIKEGGRFGIATGRFLTNALSFLDGVKPNGFCILTNGCQLYDYSKQQYVAEHMLDKEKLLPFIEKCLTERKTLGVEIYTKDLCHIVSRPKYSQKAILRDRSPLRHDTLRETMNYEWFKILFYGIEADMNWLMEESIFLEEQYLISRVRSGGTSIEFLPFGVSKGAAVKRLKDLVERTSIIFAVGDYYNDLEMLQMADVGIAVGNAPQEVKACADMVCADNEHDAIADVVGRILPEAGIK